MAPDAPTAEAWSDELARSGIQAQVEMDDSSWSAGTPSMLTQLRAPGASMWAYVLLVSPEDRKRARTTLEALWADTAPADTTFAVKSALIAVASLLLIGVVLVLLHPGIH